MATKNTPTKRENFTEIAKVLRAVDREDLAAVMEHEIDLLNRKNSKSGEKKVNEKVENAKTAILNFLASAGKSNVREIMAGIKEDNDRFVVSVLTQLRAHDKDTGIDTGLVVKTMEKGKSYYALQ